MAEIGGQLWQQILDIGTIRIPGDDPVNDPGVTKVMKTRLATASTFPLNASMTAQSTKCALRHVFGYSLAASGTEEQSFVNGRVLAVALREILVHRFG